MRRIPPVGVLRRRLYEVDFGGGTYGKGTSRQVSRTPVTVLDKVVGVGDAWALVRAADEAWDGATGGWVALTGEPGDQPS